MRPQDPVSGVPGDERGYATADQDRWHHLKGRGPAGRYVTLPTTLEEEALNGGWKPNDTPTGPPPRRLYTIGMRGEPGFDDDPSPTIGNSYTDPGPQIDTGDTSSSWD